MYRSIREFGVDPRQTASRNAQRLQAAIDWAAPRGAALFIDPADQPYMLDGGVVLKQNASLIGVHGPVGRGTRHPQAERPVGSVLATEDTQKPLITVEGAAQIRGIQFWYPAQSRTSAAKVIEYPATIKASSSNSAQGVTLSCLTFYGEFFAMDFNCSPQVICEQVLCEHCYGYPLSGRFISIDYCYDIPRLLHCHVNPANRRFIDGGYSREVIDSVAARDTYTYWIDHTDNAQLMDVFTFGVHGGIWLGPATYGQLTNFNLDCVTIGVFKSGDSPFNRNWQIAQGSIIANVGKSIEDIHPFVITGQGHTTLTGVESFSGPNGAITAIGSSYDFMRVQGDRPCTISLFGCRMRNYKAPDPLTIVNPKAVVQAVACIDHSERPYNRMP